MEPNDLGPESQELSAICWSVQQVQASSISLYVGRIGRWCVAALAALIRRAILSQSCTLARPMPWNRDRPLDREWVTPRDSSAALSVRLVPGRPEFAWHHASHSLHRSLEVTCM